MKPATTVDLNFIRDVLGIRPTALEQAIADAEYMLNRRPASKIWQTLLDNARQELAGRLDVHAIELFAGQLRDYLSLVGGDIVPGDKPDLCSLFYDARVVGDWSACLNRINVLIVKNKGSRIASPAV